MRPHRKASACSRLFGGIASALGLELRPIGLRDADEIERGITAFVREGDGGLIVTASGPAIVHRTLIVALAARHKCFPFLEVVRDRK
jgi:putative tryptophan/tyrosine transport system substrate-binding protein